MPGTEESGQFRIATANGQDHMVVVTAGAITDRRLEHLGGTDAGLIMYRQLLLEQARVAADGGEPINVRRSQAGNRRIDLPQVAAGSPRVPA